MLCGKEYPIHSVQVLTGVVAILAGLIGYFAATHIIALLMATILGIGVGWVPQGILGVLVRSAIAIFMVIYCGKYFKKWINNKIGYY